MAGKQSLESSLAAGLERLGERIGAREAGHRESVERAQACANALHHTVEHAIERFNAAAASAGAPQLRIEVGQTRTDDKHLRAVEFDLRRGRHRAIVTVKARGEVTLVGPFKHGKQEGPCRSFPWDEQQAIEGELAGFLERFCEGASEP